MYDYTPLRESGIPTRAFHVSDDLMINGKYLSDIIPGYQQLHVSGRGLVPRSVQRDTIPRRSGSWYHYGQDEERILEVTFKLTVNQSRDMRERYWELNKILRGPLDIQFRDELEYHYQAYFLEGNSNPEQSLSLVDTFKLVCTDPYKYKEPVTSNGVVESDNWLKLVKVYGDIKRDTQSITITNGQESIQLEGNFAKGDSIAIDFGDEVSITKNGNNILYALQLGSDLENFGLRSGQAITSKEMTVSFVWREYRL